MRTKGQSLIDDLQSAMTQLKTLNTCDHEPQNIADVLVQAGTKLELFFKDAVFPDANKQDDASTVINRLKSLGVPNNIREMLHAARVACNDSKHDPRFGISVPNAVGILQGAVTAIDDLIRRDISGVRQPLFRGSMRLYWVAAWDHYVHGDTEVHVTLPYLANGWAPTFDLYNIDINSWQSLKDQLGEA